MNSKNVMLTKNIEQIKGQKAKKWLKRFKIENDN
jgi:hypothetical protein